MSRNNQDSPEHRRNPNLVNNWFVLDDVESIYEKNNYVYTVSLWKKRYVVTITIWVIYASWAECKGRTKTSIGAFPLFLFIRPQKITWTSFCPPNNNKSYIFRVAQYYYIRYMTWIIFFSSLFCLPFVFVRVYVCKPLFWHPVLYSSFTPVSINRSFYRTFQLHTATHDVQQHPEAPRALHLCSVVCELCLLCAVCVHWKVNLYIYTYNIHTDCSICNLLTCVLLSLFFFFFF